MTDSYKIAHKEKNGEVNLVFSGQLTINNIEKIASEIKTILEKPTAVNIQVKEVENLDLTFVQLIYSIKNSGKKNNFKVTLSVSLSEELNSLVANAGFDSFLTEN
ncbi:STAS domain-containing protein [Geofilum sp. OHC36d9]|uniref:STAS domain-containing protein n=1 Tax=Geofilum sp. OHC36d9 TaxID=3458413 RepID=UPI004034BFE1